MVGMIRHACDKVATEHNLVKYCKEQLGMIRPIELVLRSHDDDGDESTNQHSMQYVPIMETVKFILGNEDIVSHILQRERKHNHDPDVLCDYTDGEIFKNHSFYSTESNCIKLQLQFYIDEFEVVNPLGSKRGKHKLSAVYFVIGNIHQKYRSKLEHIYLCLLVRHAYVESPTNNDRGKTYSYEEILDPLLRDLDVFQTVGLDVMYQGKKYISKAPYQHCLQIICLRMMLGGFKKISTPDACVGCV